MSPAGLRRYRAERLLRKGFPELRSKVLGVVRSQLRGKGITLDTADLEACYAEAWQGLYATVLGGEQVENPSAWLVLVTFRRAIDESRAASRAGVVKGGEMGACPPLSGAQTFDLASVLDDRTRLREVFEAMRATLSARECEAASLCYLQGLSRAEAAKQIGISEARMRKLMEGTGPGRPGVAAKVGELLDTIKGGGWCEQQSSLMRAYAFGVLDPEGERHALAVAHRNACPACRAYVASLRGLASVLPPLPLLSRFVLAGGAGATAGGSSVATGGSSVVTGTGIAGSLTAKLAVTALVVLGTGYAVLGSRAHGSPVSRHSTAAPRSFVGGALPRASSPRRNRTTTGHRARRVTSHSSPRHTRSSRSTHPAGEAAAREFGPERVVTTASPAPRPIHPSAATNEFGFE
jgi:DNA-directed RNA polymerase specialized sigma24 family protein